MNFLFPVYTESNECQDCHKCIRHCPVKAIRVINERAEIIPQMCVACGRCVIHCTAQAKRVRNDVPKALSVLKSKERVIVSLAPAFAADFFDCTPSQLIQAILELGFYGVSETAIGADIVSSHVAEDLRKSSEGKTAQKLFLSSACPAVVEYIKKEKSDFAPFITNRASPLLAHARFLKKHYGNDIGVVFIGPCFAKKRESDVWNEIDVALTFSDLRSWFQQRGIDPKKMPKHEKTDFIPFRAAKGTLYPIDGGMITSLKKYAKLQRISSMTISGLDEIAHALNGLSNDTLSHPVFIELLACAGGCINGPGMSVNSAATAVKRVRLLEFAENAADTIKVEEQDVSGTLPAEPTTVSTYGESEIKNALRSIGKYTKEDEINCGSCGYDTCRFFVQSMLDNRAEKTMCVSYMRKLAQRKANGLIQAMPSGVVVADKNMTIIECNKNFARLMGSSIEEMYEAKPGLEGADLTKIASFSHFFTDVLTHGAPDLIEREVREGNKIFQITVFVIEPQEIAGAVIADITAPQGQKNRIINQARKVIHKNLSVVQKIAFLLGENAAETESMLNSIIDSFGEDDDRAP